MAQCPIHFPDDQDAQAHYMGSRSVENGDDMACFHLLRVSDQRIDGFIALKATHHTDAGRDIGDYNVAYAFIVPSARGQRLSRLLCSSAISYLLRRFEGCETLSPFDLRSSSEPISEQGAVFMERMESELAISCMTRRWAFAASPYTREVQRI